MAISNIKNFIKELNKKEYSLIIIANSEAVKGYLGEVIIKEVEALSNLNVVFKVCNQSLLSNNISKNQIKDFIEIVDTSIVEISHKQNFENYSYLKL